MPRILHLVGVSLAAAASTTLNCVAGNCTSCVTTGGVSVCSAAYTAVTVPPCLAICLAPFCPSTPTTPASACNVCTGTLLGVGVCLPTFSNIGFALSSQASLDFGADLLSTLAASSTVATTIDASNGTVAAASSVVTLNGGSTAIANVSVGAANANSVAIFEVNSATTVTSWNNNAAAAKVDNSVSLTVNSLVTGSSFFSVWNNASATVTFNSIDFTARTSFGAKYETGIVHVSGGSVIVNAAGVKSSGTLKITGGASISTGTVSTSGTVSGSGSLPSGLIIDITAQGTSGPVAVVDAGTVLETSGAITSNGNTGVLAVNGQLRLGATTSNVSPKIIINSAATVVINAAAAFNAKAVSVAATATLEFNSSTKAAAQAGTVVIEKIDQCLGFIKINLDTSISAFASSMAGGAIAFNYSSSNKAEDLAKCTVRVVDSTGAMVTLQSTTSASASTGRRLLASSNTATWGSNGMSYQMTGQSNSALPSCIVLPAVVVSFLGLLL